MIWTRDGKTPEFDYRGQRIAAGTIGGEHAVPHSLAGGTVASIVDDANPRITYGTYGGSTAAFSSFASEGYTQRGTQTIIGSMTGTGTPTSAAVMNFDGTSIGVMGGTNPYSGVMSVYIDGVLTPGRLPTSVAPNISLLTSTSQPVLAVGGTSLTTLTIPAGFTASGTLLLGNELLTYSSKTATVFTISPATQNHYADETVYLWGSSTDLSTTTDYANKRLLYYNPFLTQGPHRIIIVVSVGATAYSRIYFDGFITGSLVGSSNLFTQTGTITSSPTFDANGHCDVGGIVSNNSDVSIIGILGYTQTNCESTNTTIMAKLGVRYQPDGSPYLYLHNGPPSTSATILITFMYIGESL